MTLSDAGDDPVLEPAPGETPLWGTTRITGLFPADADLEALQTDLMEQLSLDRLPSHHIEQLAERDWEREWLRDFQPTRFGERLWVCPRELEIDQPDAVVVTLDPGLAFGTGTHATTALCLEWLDSIDLRGKTVLDYGCGSGILAVAALKLGAESACAVDIDPQAVLATGQNAAVNGVADKLIVMQEAGPAGARFDVVLANILATTLTEMAAPISDSLRPGGALALSGILPGQVGGLTEAYQSWISFEAPVTRDGWARLTGTKT